MRCLRNREVLMINWKVRIKNRVFWATLIPAIILVIQLVMGLFGWNIDLTEISGKLVAIVDAVFVVLTILGVVHDPTTKGINDSERALSYREPN